MQLRHMNLIDRVLMSGVEISYYVIHKKSFPFDLTLWELTLKMRQNQFKFSFVDFFTCL